MFTRRMFAGRYFAPRYFPPVDSALPPEPPEPPTYYGSSRQRWRRTEDVMRQWKIEQDDEELMFWIE